MRGQGAAVVVHGQGQGRDGRVEEGGEDVCCAGGCLRVAERQEGCVFCPRAVGGERGAEG